MVTRNIINVLFAASALIKHAAKTDLLGISIMCSMTVVALKKSN
jgi:hypothetical protein